MQPKIKKATLEEIALEFKAIRFTDRLMFDLWGVWVDLQLKRFYRSSEPQDACFKNLRKGAHQVNTATMKRAYHKFFDHEQIVAEEIARQRARFAAIPAIPSNLDLFNATLEALLPDIEDGEVPFYVRAIGDKLIVKVVRHGNH